MTYWNNKEEVLEAVRADGMSLEHASVELRADREVVMAAVNNDSWAFQFASEEIRNDREVTEEAFYGGNQNDASGLAFASEELKDNKGFIIDLFSTVELERLCPDDLSYVSETLRDDKELVLLAMKNGYCLEHASERLRGDKEVVLAAIKGFDDILGMAAQYGTIDEEVFDNFFPLRFASKELRANREVILAVFTYGETFIYSEYFTDLNIDIFKWEEFDKDGNLTITEEYNNGKLIE